MNFMLIPIPSDVDLCGRVDLKPLKCDPLLTHDVALWHSTWRPAVESCDDFNNKKKPALDSLVSQLMRSIKVESIQFHGCKCALGICFNSVGMLSRYQKSFDSLGFEWC